MKCSRFTTCCLTVILLGGLASAAAQTPLGTEFTYQGQLNESGVLADGDYDFVFRLYDADTGGMQIGSDFPVDDWPVSDGLFTVQVDFGDSAFNSEARWLEVAVRPWDSNDPHTVLSPRQPVTAAPVALYALDGPGATGLWEAVGNNIVNTNSGFVGINRTDTVTGAEYFGIQTPTGDGAWGGMYIRTDSTTGKPFYGYNTGAETAWTYLDGSTGTWYLYNDGARITVEDTGNVGIGTPSPSTALEVNGTVTATAFVGDGSGLTGIPGTLWETSGSDIYYNAGNVGIGTSTPSSRLHVGGDVNARNITLNGNTSGGVDAYTSTTTIWPQNAAVYGAATNMDSHGYLGGAYGAYGNTASVLPDAAGVWGTVSSTTPGSSSAGVRGQNFGTGGSGIGVYGSQDGSGYGVYGYTPSGRGVYGRSGDGWGVYGRCDAIDWSGIGVYGSHAGYGVGVHGVSANGIGVYGRSTNGTYAGWFDGTVNVDVLEITGADVAEKFPVSEEVEPGMVVAIDPKHPGQLCLARGAYNRCVAGVVSGANDLPTGAVLGHLPGHDDAPPIALSGRVWVYCDATEQSIEPGDLLTTSGTPGHAMKVTDHARAQGAVIGKAMTALESGQDLVLVLVSLQ